MEMDPELMLDKAVNLAYKSKAIKKQQLTVEVLEMIYRSNP